MSGLNSRQIRFCEEYIIDLNATKAAIRAGYSPAAARSEASRLQTNANIIEYIAQLKKERSERTKIAADDVLYNLWDIAQEDISNFLTFKTNEKGQIVVTVKDSETVNTKNINQVSLGKKGEFKLKLYCRDNALVQVGRHIGMFNDKAEITVTGGLEILKPGVKPKEGE